MSIEQHFASPTGLVKMPYLEPREKAAIFVPPMRLDLITLTLSPNYFIYHIL